MTKSSFQNPLLYQNLSFQALPKLLQNFVLTYDMVLHNIHSSEEDFHIRMTLALESEVSLMCNLSKGVEEKGIEKGQ